MNDHLVISANGLRLLTDYEKGPDDGTVRLSQDGAALDPYVCPGGELTIGYGCTRWFDGTDVEIHHRLSGEDEARHLLDIQLDEYEEAVRRHATRALTQNQFDAFCALCFNIGIGSFSTDCSALDVFNETGRTEDAAANFGKWTGSTCDRPPKWLREDADLSIAYASKMAKDHKGGWRWVGPDGQYCRYMLRYKGLLSRHYAEALLFMGWDWTRARAGYPLKLKPTHPDKAIWNAKKNRWQDEVESRTPFKDVLGFAYGHVLPVTQYEREPVSATPHAEIVRSSPQDSAGRAGELVLQDPIELPTDLKVAPGAQPDAGAASPVKATQPAGGVAASSQQPIPAGRVESPGPVGEKGAVRPPIPGPPPTPHVSDLAKDEHDASVVLRGPAPPTPPVGTKPPQSSPSLAQQRDAVNSTQSMGIDPSSAKSMILSRRFWGLFMIITGRIVFAVTGANTVLNLAGDPIVSELVANVMVMIASSAWEYCGEIVQTWGRVKAKRNLT